MVKLAHLQIRLATLLTQSKNKDRRVKLKTVTKLENLTGTRWCMTLDLGSLIHQKFKAKKDYQKRLKECLMIRATHTEERSRAMAAKGNSREE